MSDAWDTPLGQWRLAWVEYLRGNSPGIPDGSVVIQQLTTEDADAAFQREIDLAREVCADQVEGDAAASHAPDAATSLVVFGIVPPPKDGGGH